MTVSKVGRGNGKEKEWNLDDGKREGMTVVAEGRRALRSRGRRSVLLLLRQVDKLTSTSTNKNPGSVFKLKTLPGTHQNVSTTKEVSIIADRYL